MSFPALYFSPSQFSPFALPIVILTLYDSVLFPPLFLWVGCFVGFVLSFVFIAGDPPGERMVTSVLNMEPTNVEFVTTSLPPPLTCNPV